MGLLLTHKQQRDWRIYPTYGARGHIKYTYICFIYIHTFMHVLLARRLIYEMQISVRSRAHRSTHASATITRDLSHQAVGIFATYVDTSHLSVCCAVRGAALGLNWRVGPARRDQHTRTTSLLRPPLYPIYQVCQCEIYMSASTQVDVSFVKRRSPSSTLPHVSISPSLLDECIQGLIAPRMYVCVVYFFRTKNVPKSQTKYYINKRSTNKFVFESVCIAFRLSQSLYSE
jgi:hypothetical protein